MSGAQAYGDCVNSLSHSLSFLESSVQTLERATADLPRLATTLKATRHYELIPQPSLAAAESSLRDEIGPYINVLLDRADAQVERQERRIETLKARSEQLAGRLVAEDVGDIPHGRGGSSSARHQRSGSSQSGRRAGSRGQSLGGERALRAKAVRTRKEGLKYSVERLELELEQKEKELRKRLEKA